MTLDVVSICMHVPMPGVHENTVIYMARSWFNETSWTSTEDQFINGDEFLFLTTVTRATC
jgi:hypothetical protein